MNKKWKKRETNVQEEYERYNNFVFIIWNVFQRFYANIRGCFFVVTNICQMHTNTHAHLASNTVFTFDCIVKILLIYTFTIVCEFYCCVQRRHVRGGHTKSGNKQSTRIYLLELVLKCLDLLAYRVHSIWWCTETIVEFSYEACVKCVSNQ